MRVMSVVRVLSVLMVMMAMMVMLLSGMAMLLLMKGDAVDYDECAAAYGDDDEHDDDYADADDDADRVLVRMSE